MCDGKAEFHFVRLIGGSDEFWPSGNIGGANLGGEEASVRFRAGSRVVSLVSVSVKNVGNFPRASG